MVNATVSVLADDWFGVAKVALVGGATLFVLREGWNFVREFIDDRRRTTIYWRD
ncbi:MAG: hypothetical protein ACOYBY_17775 [Dermatophilaceae bacterium]